MKNIYVLNKHIYITSDEEISGFENNIWVIQGKRVYLWKNTMALVSNHKPKKIILTTDQDLIKDGVQVIDDEFLEWFVKNPSCEYAKVEDYGNLYNFRYLIIIPKEEPKPFKDMLQLTKVDWEKFKKNPIPNKKQETLEYGILQHIKMCLECNNESQAIRLLEKYGFEKQEEMYSGEEVIQIIRDFKYDSVHIGDMNPEKWFEHFKNK